MTQETKDLLIKVPEITLFFWIIKILCTTVGETFADYLNVTLGFGLNGTTLVMGALLIVALIFQFKSSKYIPSIYWLNVVLISVFGTLLTDNLIDNIGISLISTTIVFSIILACVFAIWYKSEKTLSVHSITTTKRESFYWLTILFTFALGTASGDLLAEKFAFGYIISAGIFFSVIASVYILHSKFKLNSILAFWIAYIFTRPLGASVGDYLSQTQDKGGLGLGTTYTSIVFLVMVMGIIFYLTKTKADEISM